MSAQRDTRRTSPRQGVLYIVGTPIGNLEDITLRALRILKEADLIAAEDTRRTRKLLSKYEIHVPMTSYHEHNKAEKTPRLLSKLKNGARIALVSDAGMPGISDPGQDLIVAALEEAVEVTVVPGPSSIIAALVLSALQTGSFTFFGFPPRKAGERLNSLHTILNRAETAVLFESPNRLPGLLKTLAQLAPTRKVAVARELTKKFEEVVRGTAGEVAERFGERKPKGECVVVIEGLAETDSSESNVEPQNAGKLVAEIMRTEGLTKKEAMRKAAKTLRISRREVYQAVLEDDGR